MELYKSLIILAEIEPFSTNIQIQAHTGITLGVGYCDFFLLILLIIGVLRGRSRGMAVELIDFLQWLFIIFGCALFYEPFGNLVHQDTDLSMTFSYLFAYLLFALIVKIFALVIKHYFGLKLVSSSVFGKSEYGLGMAAGMIRFLCIGLFLIALLHSTEIDTTSIENHLKSQTKENNKVIWPNLAIIQKAIFEESYSGRFLDKYGSFFLIVRSKEDKKNETLAKQRERLVDEAIGK